MSKDKVGTAVKILLVVAILLGGYVYFFMGGSSEVAGVYEYSNGETVFEVNKVSEIETFITLLVGAPESYEYTIAMRNDPLSLEDIPSQGTYHTRIHNDEAVYITIHPEANLTSRTTIAALEIDKIIDNPYLYEIPVYSANTQENDYGYPVVDCGDATDSYTVIFLTLGSETTVFAEEHCIYIVGTDEDEIIRAADRFIYSLLGIMD